MLYREQFEAMEEMQLAPCAMKSKYSKGRRYKEQEHPLRTCFQRDRDRIIHSLAFRRLEYKTQVFVNYEGDHYRTRLTHTIEVLHVACTLSKILRLNNDLTEAISYAHDLGHTPFGHAGERTLDRLMKNHGGFEHNVQSLRVVDLLEKNYPDFPGLNLTHETRDGLMKHRTTHDKPVTDDLDLSLNPSLEAQVVNVSDEISYICHDLEDGLRSGILNEYDLREIKLWHLASRDAKRLCRGKFFKEFQFQTIRFLKNLLVTDCAEASHELLKENNINDIEQVYNAKHQLIGFHDDIAEGCNELNAFLMDSFYQDYHIVRMSDKADMFLTELFNRYLKRPSILPPKIQKRMTDDCPERIICDYIAGMTDRFALEEYKKLFDPFESV